MSKEKSRIESVKRFMFETFNNVPDEVDMESISTGWELVIRIQEMDKEFKLDDRTNWESFLEDINCKASEKFEYFSKVFDEYFEPQGGEQDESIGVEVTNQPEKEYLTHFRNYQKYDRKGRRLAIFGDIMGDKLRFYVFRCSKEDVFSKEKAVEFYQKYKKETIESWLEEALYAIPLVFEVIIVDKTKVKNLFIEVCNDKFCEKIAHYTITKYSYKTREESIKEVDDLFENK